MHTNLNTSKEENWIIGTSWKCKHVKRLICSCDIVKCVSINIKYIQCLAIILHLSLSPSCFHGIIEMKEMDVSTVCWILLCITLQTNRRRNGFSETSIWKLKMFSLWWSKGERQARGIQKKVQKMALIATNERVQTQCVLGWWVFVQFLKSSRQRGFAETFIHTKTWLQFLSSLRFEAWNDQTAPACQSHSNRLYVC